MILLATYPDQFFNKVSFSSLDRICPAFTQIMVFYRNNTGKDFFAKLGIYHNCQIKDNSQKKIKNIKYRIENLQLTRV